MLNVFLIENRAGGPATVATGQTISLFEHFVVNALNAFIQIRRMIAFEPIEETTVAFLSENACFTNGVRRILEVC